MYLSCAALQGRLRDHGLSPSGTRTVLLQRCRTNGLISPYEFLAKRNIKESRKEWLVHELTELGCSLRGDSVLCADYIEDGRGNPKDIAQVMAEMNFYYSHTEYDAIREGIHSEAEAEYRREMREYSAESDDNWGYGYGRYDRELRPRFSDFYNSHEASSQAKSEAFDRWLSGLPSLEDALVHPDLPATLKRQVLGSIAKSRYDAWVSRAYGDSALIRRTAFDCNIANAFLFLEDHDLTTYTTDEFEKRFGSQLRSTQILEQLLKHFDQTMTLEFQKEKNVDKKHWRKAITHVLEQALKVKMGNDPKNEPDHESIKSTMDKAICNVINDALPTISSLAVLLGTLGPSGKIRIDLKRSEFDGIWHCRMGAKCKYKGAFEGVINHCRNKHHIDCTNASNLHNVRAYRDTSSFTLTVDQFLDIVEKIETVSVA